MGLISTSVPSLVQGVSQQPAATRFPSQAELQENAFPSVVDGLVKRHPTEHVAKVINGAAGAAQLHIINRDSSERYLVVLRSGSVKVFTPAGVVVPVFGPGGAAATFTYLDSDPENYRALTVADYTFVSNRTKLAGTVGTNTALRPSEGLAYLSIIRGAYLTNYDLRIDNTNIAPAQDFRVSTWDGVLAKNGQEVWTVEIRTVGTVGQTWTVVSDGNTANHLVLGPDTTLTIAASLAGTLNAFANISAVAVGSVVTITADTFNDPIPTAVTSIATNGLYTLTNTKTAGMPELQSIKTDDIAQAFTDAINNTFAVTGYVATRVGSVVEVTHATFQLTEFRVTDSQGDTASVGLWKSVKSTSALPLTCRNAFTVRIAGEDSDVDNDYFVKFVADGGASAFGVGHWEEGIDYDTPTTFVGSTMPHTLIRKQDDVAGTITGTPFAIYFEWGPAAWTAKAVGDYLNLNTAPSFSGDYIRDIFFFQNRLCFLSDQNVIMSEVGRYFNFWRTTVQTIVDSDPIDVSAAHTSVSLLNSAIPLDERLVLFSDRTQFVLAGTDILSPRTVSINLSMEYENYVLPRPITTGRGILFGYKRAGFSGLREVFPLDARSAFDTDDVTASVPKYIVGDVAKIASSTLEDIAVILSKGRRSSLWIYKYFWSGQQKLQSAWGEYTFGSDASIQGIDFIENTLYILVQRAQGLFIEKSSIGSGITDANATYITYLDRRVTEAGLVFVYDGINNRSTYTLPYDVAAGKTMKVVTRSTSPNNGGATLPTYAVDTSVSGSHKITVTGNLTGVAVWIGESYTMRYQFSEPTLKEDTSRGARGLIAAGRYQLRYGTIVYDDSAYFKVVVTPLQRAAIEYPFTAQFLGSEVIVIGQLPIESGKFRFAILSRADQVTIEVQNDSPLPSNLLSAEWEAKYTSRSTRNTA